MTLLFADTLIEDEDLYRFLDEASRDVGVPVTRVADGRTPWEVFRDVNMIGNARVDPCSRVLKRSLLRRWIEERFDPSDTTIYLGIGWMEEHRLRGARKYWGNWDVQAPLCEPPLIEHHDLLLMAKEAGIKIPRLYRMGFFHNNCGGFCVKAGIRQFSLLYEKMPDRYLWHEEQEERMRERLGKDVAILKDRTGGVTRPLTLRRLRQERLEAGAGLSGDEKDDWGGCACGV